ncbi:hypothetical protein HDV03_002478 [Kappamyces sp. JEL0829]|nr:hypothetical protein HDV03_002478 [Kappamyces sp. JEL0829]
MQLVLSLLLVLLGLGYYFYLRAKIFKQENELVLDVSTVAAELLAADPRPVASKHSIDYLVLGGSGFVGRHVVEHLLQERPEAKVRVFDLRNAFLADPRVQFIKGDITSPADVDAAMKGVDKVLYLASAISTSNYAHKVLRKVNIEGCKNVMRAALASGIRALVYTSSASAVWGQDGFDENRPIHYMFPYGQSKHTAEKLVLACSRPDLPMAAIRPMSIAGANDSVGTIDDLYFEPANPTVAMPGFVQDTIYVKDLARAHVMLVDALVSEQSSRCAGKAYFCSKFADGTVDFYNYVQAVHAAFHPTLGVKHHLSDSVLAVMTKVSNLVQFLTLGEFTSDLVKVTSAIFALLRTNFDFDNAPAERDFGWKPLFSMDAAIADIVRLQRKIK